MSGFPQNTQSLCPVCLKKIRAARTVYGKDVHLDKICPEHGLFSTPIWRGTPAMEKWHRPKQLSGGRPGRRPVNKGCPFDCGLCVEHRQRSCTVILDVSYRCNLRCPVCFADADPADKRPDLSLDEVARRFEGIFKMSPGSNIQISGGEPTLRDDLDEIIRMGKQAGFTFIQVNTNGLRLAQDAAYLKRLADAGLDSIFFQFDGTNDSIYQKIRGRDLFEIKQEVLRRCSGLNLGVVLVATVVPGVNDRNLGQIIDLAIAHTPTVRGVHFQPVSYFGRYPETPPTKGRITLPELMQAIEIQTDGRFKIKHFSPSGCEHSLCSFSGRFLVQDDLSVNPFLSEWQGCCGTIESAENGAARSIAQTARQWSGPPGEIAEPKTADPISVKGTGLMDLDDFIRQARTRTLAVSAMAFQDAWTLDLERVQGCCIHVADAPDRLIPFCLYHLTGTTGKKLYP